MKELENIGNLFNEFKEATDKPDLWDLSTYLSKCNISAEQIEVIIAQVFEHGQNQWSKGYDKGHEVAKKNLIQALNNV